MADEPGNGGKAFVTMRDLDDKLEKVLEKVPSRWEVRFLVLAALVATQVLPASDVARAAVGWIP